MPSRRKILEPVGLAALGLPPGLPPLPPCPASKLFSINFSMALRTDGEPSALVGVDEVRADEAATSLPLADPTLIGLALGDGLVLVDLGVLRPDDPFRAEASDLDRATEGDGVLLLLPARMD